MQLHIPQPCSASWEQMQPTEKGRHCAACAKQVVDFTSMSDEEVLRYLKKAPRRYPLQAMPPRSSL